MDVEPHDQQSHAADNGYGGGAWVELGGFQHTSPQNHLSHPPSHHHHQHQQVPEPDYNSFHFFGGHPPAPPDPNYHNAMAPPMVHPIHSIPMDHQPLRPLITPPWPSMLTSQSSPYPTSLLPTGSVPIQNKMISPTTSTTNTRSAPTTSPRRTLTDADRRRMCVYHEENPTVKQTEIGAMFGVERSTVSKVLRQKEKYLFPDDGSRSPIQKSTSKGRFPDIERALSNWARNTQKTGTPVTDTMIREKARFFATTVGSSDSHTKITSTAWLEKFKQKNHVGGVKSRKNSEAATESGMSEAGDTLSAGQTPHGISPSSPVASGVASPSRLSSRRSHDNLHPTEESSQAQQQAATNTTSTTSTTSPGDGPPPPSWDFQGYRLTTAASQSTTSLSSVFSDPPPGSSFSAGPASPTSPFFSADGQSPFLPNQSARLSPLASAVDNSSGAVAGGYSRGRSQSYPHHALDGSSTYGLTGSPGSGASSKYLGGHTALEAADGMAPPHLSIDATINPMPNLHNAHIAESSSGNNTARGVIQRSASLPGIDTTPSQEEARRALAVVLAYIEGSPGGMEMGEYMVVGKLMDKLRLGSEGVATGSGLGRIQEEPGGSGSGSGSGLGLGDAISGGRGSLVDERRASAA